MLSLILLLFLTWFLKAVDYYISRFSFNNPGTDLGCMTKFDSRPPEKIPQAHKTSFEIVFVGLCL